MKNRVVIYCRRFEPCRAAQQHRHGRSLLEQALKEEYQIDFTEDMITLMANGKPCFKELPIFFNISHCSSMAVCALADVPVGVDVENGRRVKDSLVRRALSPWEQAYVKEQPELTEGFLELWTLKESFIKMTGEGLRSPLNTVNFRLRESIEDGEGISEGAKLWRSPDRIWCSCPGRFVQWKLDGGYMLSLCMQEERKIYLKCNR